MKERIVCFGPGPKFKGGISNYNTSLAKAIDALGHEVHIVSWTQQYPAIIPREFIDKSSTSDFLEGTNIQVTYVTNYNNPLTWNKTIKTILELKPTKVIIQWAIAIQGLPLGYIAKKLSKAGDIEVIFDLHFVDQKENSKLDKRFTLKGIRHAHTYVCHAQKTVDELKKLLPKKDFSITTNGERQAGKTNVIKLYHPVYDLFKPNEQFDKAAFKKENELKEHVFLFFGFIRKYKGLHNAIEAFAKLAEERDDVSLLICGESFWKTLDKKKFITKVKTALFGFAKKLFLRKKDDEKDYRPLELIEKLGITDKVMVVNSFIPNGDVHKYFQVSDAVILFYEYATPSGVESLSYNFGKPILATPVGHFPETIKAGKNGYLAKANSVDAMVDSMRKCLENTISGEKVDEFAKELSWERYARAVLDLRL